MTRSIIGICEFTKTDDKYDMKQINSNKGIDHRNTRSRIVDSKRKKFCLTGYPIDPNVILSRKSAVYDEYLKSQEKRGFFDFISKQFSEASKRHFKDNPSGRIKTSHLSVSSMACFLNKNESGIDSLSRDVKINSFERNSQAQILAKSFSQIKSSSWNLGQFKSIENKNQSEIINSRVLALDESKMRDPDKFLELVSYFGSKKSTEYYRKLKIEHRQSKLKHSIKDKPTYHLASQKCTSMYCLCKVCGLKECKCKENTEILPFSSLSNKEDNNESISINNDSQVVKQIHPQYKISTIRALTAEPIHRKHARLFKNGKRICRFSDLK